MKRIRALCVASLNLLLATTLFGQSGPVAVPLPYDTTPPPSPDDIAWRELVESKISADREFKQLPAQANARAAEVARRAGKSIDFADRAKVFYETRPDHSMAAEARRLEIVGLIQAEEDGDRSISKRLEKAISELRGNTKIPQSTRAHASAAFEFTRGARGKKQKDALEAVEKSARSLMVEFPGEAPAYEAILAVAEAVPLEKSRALAAEIAGSGAPAEVRLAAQVLVARYGLVAKSLTSELTAEATEQVRKLRSGDPTIIYSWATWAPGSIELGKMLQARRFNAVGVCLDEDLPAARLVRRRHNLGGEHIFDEKGRSGELAAKLKFSTAGQIYLVDAAGVIRDVRGGENLEAKLKELGFKTPPIPTPTVTR